MNKLAKILAVSGILVALGGCTEEAPQAASVAPGLDVVEQGVAGQGAVAPAADEPVDPFAGEMPDFMVDAAVQRIDGELLDLSLQRELFDYASEHPKDPRPWLLLADDSVAREFYGMAAQQYGSALQADSRVRTMLGLLDKLDLIIEAGDDFARRAASELVVTYWGAEALPPAAE